jgi:hypothetical protein
MSVVAFDTLNPASKLETAGFCLGQAKGTSAVLAEPLDGSILATKLI